MITGHGGTIEFAGQAMKLAGFKIIECPHMAEIDWKQVRFPRSKKRRIRNKWAKQRKNFASIARPMDKAYKIGNQLVMHPAMAEQLRRRLDKIAGQIDWSQSLNDFTTAAAPRLSDFSPYKRRGLFFTERTIPVIRPLSLIANAF